MSRLQRFQTCVRPDGQLETNRNNLRTAFRNKDQLVSAAARLAIAPDNELLRGMTRLSPRYSRAGCHRWPTDDELNIAARLFVSRHHT